MAALRRRDFVGLGIGAGAALAFGLAFWRQAFNSPVEPGVGYGPLRGPDANGLMLPSGFRARLVARGGQPVAGTTYDWHELSDGAATFSTPDGGWILVSNSETDRPDGGASAIRFNRDGSVAGAYPILEGTDRNCAGGPTPWGTWLSCEEVEEGRVWECDPTGRRPAVERPALGVFQHEATAVDPGSGRLYLTEDLADGGFYRFTPHRYPDLSGGTLEIATVGTAGSVAWTPVPDPSARDRPTRRQVPGATEFRRGEGIWFDTGVAYIATTADSRIHAYDTRTETLETLYDAAAFPDPPLTGVDNITVSQAGELFVCEDNNAPQLDIRLITPAREVMPFLTAGGEQHAGSELAGVTFDPSGSRMYFSSQTAMGSGAVYEVSGPFRAGGSDQA
ncbi:MAG: PhoX family protein [Actinomycetota bacterium]|nr:PhoX family protein [Actinomycetota bacterium]